MCDAGVTSSLSQLGRGAGSYVSSADPTPAGSTRVMATHTLMCPPGTYVTAVNSTAGIFMCALQLLCSDGSLATTWPDQAVTTVTAGAGTGNTTAAVTTRVGVVPEGAKPGPSKGLTGQWVYVLPAINLLYSLYFSCQDRFGMATVSGLQDEGQGPGYREGSLYSPTQVRG